MTAQVESRSVLFQYANGQQWGLIYRNFRDDEIEEWMPVDFIVRVELDDDRRGIRKIDAMFHFDPSTHPGGTLAGIINMWHGSMVGDDLDLAFVEGTEWLSGSPVLRGKWRIRGMSPYMVQCTLVGPFRMQRVGETGQMADVKIEVPHEW